LKIIGKRTVAEVVNDEVPGRCRRGDNPQLSLVRVKRVRGNFCLRLEVRGSLDVDREKEIFYGGGKVRPNLAEFS